MIDDDDTYEGLIDKLTEPTEFHDFVLPSTKGDFSFRGYISKVSDEMMKIHSDTVTFQGLTCKFTMKSFIQDTIKEADSMPKTGFRCIYDLKRYYSDSRQHADNCIQSTIC